jgi:hypothetical protein
VAKHRQTRSKSKASRKRKRSKKLTAAQKRRRARSRVGMSRLTSKKLSKRVQKRRAANIRQHGSLRAAKHARDVIRWRKKEKEDIRKYGSKAAAQAHHDKAFRDFICRPDYRGIIMPGCPGREPWMDEAHAEWLKQNPMG